MSRVRGSINEILANLNKEDIFQEESAEMSATAERHGLIQTPHTCQRSTSAPSSSKTPARKGKTDTIRSDQRAHKSRSSRPSLDKTPNHFQPSQQVLPETRDHEDVSDDDPILSQSPCRTPPVQPSVSNALKEITSLLNTVVKRIDRIENEIKRHSTPVSSSSASEGSKKNPRRKSLWW